jgi:hypothetical protein
MTRILKKDEWPKVEEKVLDASKYELDPEKWEVRVGSPTSIGEGMCIVSPEDVLVYKIINKATGVIEHEVPSEHVLRNFAQQVNAIKAERIQVPKMQVRPGKAPH